MKNFASFKFEKIKQLIVLFILIIMLITFSFNGFGYDNTTTKKINNYNSSREKELLNNIDFNEGNNYKYWFIIGKDCYNSKNYSCAIAALNKSLFIIEQKKLTVNKSELAEIWYYSGLSQDSIEDSKALLSFNNAINNNTSLIDAWQKKASIETKMGKNYTYILSIYNKSIDYNKNSSILLEAKGEYLLKSKNYNESIKFLEELIKNNNLSKNYTLWLLYGKALYFTQKYSDALNAFDNSKKFFYKSKNETGLMGEWIQPEDTTKKFFDEISFYSGLSQHGIGNYAAAIESFNTPANDSNYIHYEDALKWKAFISRSLGNNDSYKILDVANRSINPEIDREFHYYKAKDKFYSLNLTDNNNANQIRNNINESINNLTNPGFSFLFLKARYLERINKSDEAIELYNKIANNYSDVFIRSNKELIENAATPDKYFYEDLPYLRIAYIQNNLKHFNESKLAFEKVLFLDPNNNAARIALGNIQYQQGEYASAVNTFNNSTIYTREATMGKGYALKKQNKTNEAIRAFNQILLKNRHDKSAWDEKIGLLPNKSIEKSIAIEMKKSTDYYKISQMLLQPHILVVILISLAFIIIYFYKIRRTSPAIKIFYINIFNFYTFSSCLYLSAIVAPTIPYFIFILSVVIIYLFIGIILDETSSSWRETAKWAFNWFEIPIKIPIRRPKGMSQSKEEAGKAFLRVDGIFIIAIIISFILMYVSILNIINYHDDNLAYTILQYASIGLILFNLALTVIPFLNLLKSTNLERDARDLIFFGYLGYLCLLSAYISLALWINEQKFLNNNIYSITIFSKEYSLAYILIMYTLILLSLLFPYIIGDTRNKRMIESQLEKKIQNLNVLLDVLDYPERSDHMEKLNKISNDISKEIDPLEYSTFDPRKDYADFLKNYNEVIKSLIIKFEDLKGNQSELMDLSSSFAKRIRSRKEEIKAILDDEKKSKSHLYIYASLFISSLFLAIVNQLVKVISSSFIPPSP
jgi:tetratricopeptide (TPR) repeat protein